MAEIRGQKVSFSRKDIVPLHELPSSQTEDPIIVHCPPRRTRAWRMGKTVVLFVMLVFVAIGSAVFAIEGGIVDGALTSRAQSALNNAIGPRYVASVGSTAIRFDTNLRLAIEARDVDIVEQANTILVVTTPDPICVRDAQMMSDEFYNRGNKRQRLIINKVNKRAIGSELVKSLDEIIDTIGVQLIGVIPEDYELVIATGKGQPIPSTAPSLAAFDAIAKRLKGENAPLTVKIK